ncbi:hypothetical protein MMC08_008780 [Hypocenomyce scalaris]|nr:hypothetical protein [Hypocenomyce scalaris]
MPRTYLGRPEVAVNTAKEEDEWVIANAGRTYSEAHADISGFFTFVRATPDRTDLGGQLSKDTRKALETFNSVSSRQSGRNQNYGMQHSNGVPPKRAAGTRTQMWRRRLFLQRAAGSSPAELLKGPKADDKKLEKEFVCMHGDAIK